MTTPVLAAASPRLRPLRLATAAMGTRFELVLGGERPERLRAIGEAAIDIIRDCHRRLSRFAPDSLVAHINRMAHAHPVRLDADTFALFCDALAVQHASAGAFDITVGKLMDARSGEEPATSPGEPCGIALDVGARTIRFTRAGLALDLGAIAKGHALDLVLRLLREHDVACALVHGGTSSVAAIGAPPGCAGWRIALGVAESRHIIALCDAALSVSRPAGPAVTVHRAAERGCAAMHRHAARPGHILDPRTGESVRDPHLVAVVGPSARLADAWSTALAVLGQRPASLGTEWVTHWIESP